MAFFLLLAVASAVDYAVVNLDNFTLPLLVGKSIPALVRIDREYPYGDANDAFKEVALAVAGSGGELLIGHVGVSTWGDRQNSDLAVQYAGVPADVTLEYSSMDTYFPKFLFFPKNGGEKVVYSGATDKDGLKSGLQSLLKRSAGIYFGLPGCLAEFDALAADYAKAPKDTLAKAEKALAALADEEQKSKATYYVKAMKKAEEKGTGHFEAERKRMEGIMAGSIAPEKKKDMQKKLNVLSSFVI